jgi:hypothetical protein
MGMMPVSEIKIEKIYKDKLGFKITVQAGNHGWTILYADGSSMYDDIDNTPEDNLQLALETLRTYISSFEEVKYDKD